MSIAVNHAVLAKGWERFTIMHKDRKVAAIREDGTCTVYAPSFLSYDAIDGARCQTSSRKLSQREAAIEAVRAVGLNQIAEVKPEWFEDQATRDMFFRRLEEVKSERGLPAEQRQRP